MALSYLFNGWYWHSLLSELLPSITGKIQWSWSWAVEMIIKSFKYSASVSESFEGFFLRFFASYLILEKIKRFCHCYWGRGERGGGLGGGSYPIRGCRRRRNSSARRMQHWWDDGGKILRRTSTCNWSSESIVSTWTVSGIRWRSGTLVRGFLLVSKAESFSSFILTSMRSSQQNFASHQVVQPESIKFVFHCFHSKLVHV